MIIIPPVPLTIPTDVLSTNVPPDAVPQESPEDELRYQMFLPVSNRVTTSQTNILVEIKPRQRWNTLMLSNVGADRLTAVILNGPAWSVDLTLRYDAPLTPDLLNEPSVYLETPDVDPSIYPAATLVINLWVTTLRQTSCELLAVGWRVQIGRALYGTELSIQDYSLKRRDEFGAITLIERGYNDQVRYRFELATADVEWVRDLLAGRRAKPTGYLGSADAAATFVFGLYQDFTIPIEDTATCVAELTVGSVVRTGAVDTDLPNTFQAVFLPLKPGCIEDHLGFLAKLVLNDDGELGDQQVMVGVELGRELLDGETYEWVVEWDGEEDPPNIGTSAMLATSCDQHFITYTWPTGAVEPMEPGIAQMSLVFHALDGTIQASNAVVLVIQNRLEGPCTKGTVTAKWHNKANGLYELDDVFGALGKEDVRLLALKWDEDYYLDHNSDVAAVVGDKSLGATYNSGAEHYWIIGDSENRKPNAWFDPAYYKAENPDVVAQLYPAVPTHFQNSLQHYQMFGFGEGRLPCSPAQMATADTLPVGAFFWQAKTSTDGCGAGACTTSWTWTYSSAHPPRVAIVDNVVTVSADIQEGSQRPEPVTPGTLTLSATVQCPASYPGGPVPAPIELDPITLSLSLLEAGWVSGGVLLQRINEDSYSGKTWTARVDGVPEGYPVTWTYAWTSLTSGAAPTISVAAGVLSVGSAHGGGTLRAEATVTAPWATQKLAPIILVLGTEELAGPIVVGSLLWESPTNVYALTEQTILLRLTDPGEVSAPTLHLFASVNGEWSDVATLLGQTGNDLEMDTADMQAYAQVPMAVAARAPDGVWLPRSTIGGIVTAIEGAYTWTLTETAVDIGGIEGWLTIQPTSLSSILGGVLTVDADWVDTYGIYQPLAMATKHARLDGTNLKDATLVWSTDFIPWDGYTDGYPPDILTSGQDVYASTVAVEGQTYPRAIPPGTLSVSVQVWYQGGKIAEKGPVYLHFVPEDV